jgi:hypothetical protein
LQHFASMGDGQKKETELAAQLFFVHVEFGSLGYK